MNLIKIPDFLTEEEKKETESLINNRITWPPCLFQNPFTCNQILNDPVFSNPNLGSDLSDLEDKDDDDDDDDDDCGFRQTSSCGWEQDEPISCGSNGACQNQALSCSWMGMEPTEPEEEEEEEEEDDCGTCETCQRCLGCTGYCERNCTDYCERNCTSHCEDNCTAHCESNCTHICEAGCQDCQTPCQISNQHVHIWKTFYEQIANNNTHHRVYTKCIDTSCNLIIDDKKEVHNFDTTDYYHDGWAVQKCSTCGYIKRIRQIDDFEWSHAKGSDNLDVLITAEEWNRFLELLTYKLRSANKESSINHLKAVQKSSLITAEKFNGVIDKLKLIKATSVPNKVAPGALVLNHTHLNALKDSLNSARNLR